MEQQDGPQSGAQDGETKDGTVDAETKDGTNQPDNQATDAAALAGKATVTTEQAKAKALEAADTSMRDRTPATSSVSAIIP